jgi:hypothetical protein
MSKKLTLITEENDTVVCFCFIMGTFDILGDKFTAMKVPRQCPLVAPVEEIARRSGVEKLEL